MSPTAVIACGALAVHVRQIARRRGWDVDVHPVPALLHNRPERIAPAVEAELERLAEATTGSPSPTPTAGPTARSTPCSSARAPRGWPATTATTCSPAGEVRAALEEEPGTYVLTDFLARTFAHTVLRELGLDRHPELRDAYFGNYTRVLWLAQHADARHARCRRARGRLDRAAARGARGGRRRARARARGARRLNPRRTLFVVSRSRCDVRRVQ